MNFSDFNNYHEFKMKTGMQGIEAIMCLLKEIERRKNNLNGRKNGDEVINEND